MQKEETRWSTLFTFAEVADFDEVADFAVVDGDRRLEGRHWQAGHHTCGPADLPRNLLYSLFLQCMH